MHEKLKNLTPMQKDLLIKKLNLNLKRPAQKSLASEKNGNAPFGYHIPNANFNQITSKNFTPSPPGPHQIQIQAKAISLNFRDVMIGLGLYPKMEGIPTVMGGDYAGVVVACGENVDAFKVGDRVISVYGGDPQHDHHFASVINAYTTQTVMKPELLSFQEACSIPTVFLTAHFSLCHLAQLKKNEKVLVHTASGGVGQAAIQIARWKGAHVIATAGTEEKRAFLRKQGIEHVMDSRSLAFFEQIVDITHGEGIDVILNTLHGEALEKGMQLLKTFGRFVHLDKTDIVKNRLLNLDLFTKSTSFSFFDLSQFYMIEELRIVFEEVCKLFNQGVLRPIPLRRFSHREIGHALNYMAHGKHIGKIVIDYVKQ